MKKKIKRFSALLLCVMLLGSFAAATVSADDALPSSTYTYTRSGDMVPSPEVFVASKTVPLTDGSGTPVKFPTDFSLDHDGNFLVADNGNGRVLCFDETGKELWQLKSMTLNGKSYTLQAPYSILQSSNDCYYISDIGPVNDNGDPLGEGKIYQLDKNRKLIHVFEKPKANQLADDGISYTYLPHRFVVDSAERLYVVAEGVNQGFIQLNREGEFQGFIGAPAVVFDAWELVVRKFSTEEQRSRMQSFVPTEYSGVDLDDDGFIYATTQTHTAADINSVIASQAGKGAVGNTNSATEMLRKINASGVDILRRKGAFSPIGDALIPNLPVNGSPKLAASITRNQVTIDGPSRFADICALDSGMYAALDRVRNRVFLYDYDGNLICAFGSKGDRKQSFSDPVAVEFENDTVYLLNSQQGSMTVCTLTGYGKSLLAACRAQFDGDTEQSLKLWNEVLKQNTNSELAYDVIGKMYLDRDDADTAMKYFRLSSNHEYYAQAFKIHRDEVVGKNFLWVVLGVIAGVVVLSLAGKGMRRLAKGTGFFADLAARNNYCFYTLTHPFDGFYCLKHEKRGSAWLGLAQILLLGISSVLRTNGAGYCFNYTDIRYENIVFSFFTVILPYLLFAVANWALITLFDGKGTFKDIMVFTGCSTLPLTIANLIYFGLSFVCVTEESAFMSIFLTVGMVWMVFLFFTATVSIHDYTAGKAVLSLICTILGIVVIVFIILFFYDIISQIVSFVTMLYQDLSVR